MPSWTLRVLLGSVGSSSKTTQSVEDGIPSEDRGNEIERDFSTRFLSVVSVISVVQFFDLLNHPEPDQKGRGRSDWIDPALVFLQLKLEPIRV
jgi:hypothetical protein